MSLPRCSNGHLMFDTKDGYGCLKVGCPFRIVSLNKPKPKPKKKKS